jgi:hypothetical protein
MDDSDGEVDVAEAGDAGNQGAAVPGVMCAWQVGHQAVCCCPVTCGSWHAARLMGQCTACTAPDMSARTLPSSMRPSARLCSIQLHGEAPGTSAAHWVSATHVSTTTLVLCTLQAAILNYFLEKEGLVNAERLVHRGPEAVRTLPVYEGVLGLLAQVLGFEMSQWQGSVGVPCDCMLLRCA